MKRLLLPLPALMGALFLFFSCQSGQKSLFTILDASKTGIKFINQLSEKDPQLNILSFPYYYNGGGVAVGDINNDGLPDLCFTGNQVPNRLYLNKGKLQFEDITEKAGLHARGWSNGVSMADVNGDGLLDIYICRSGLVPAQQRTNLLYINKGSLQFSEEAAAYGLDDPGYSTQASFFDYDKDGDLDLYLINQSTATKNAMDQVEFVGLRDVRGDSTLENKLFRNEKGHFIQASAAAGIRSNKLSFSLGVSTADINGDGWPDLYITNDFKEPDYCYINNGNGTFTDSIAHKFTQTSLYGMGVDVSDYNNDLLPDMAVVDMLSEDNKGQKMHMGYDSYDEYNNLFRNGLFPQYMKNTLQKNNGDGTFSEVGQLAGVSNTDWSWSPLFADFDNDGLKDLFISNGYRKDITDLEFLQFNDSQRDRLLMGYQRASTEEYIDKLPGLHLSNYLFQNKGNDRFENVAAAWGLDKATFSNGAAYADLDGDGDLDLITNNVDEPAGIYRNNSESLLQHHFLKVALAGDSMNRMAVGAKVFAYAGSHHWMQEQVPVRGYQSAVDQVLHFGVGIHSSVDSVVVLWPNGKRSVVGVVKADQQVQINIKDAGNPTGNAVANAAGPLLTEVNNLLDFRHVENEFNDFTVQTLLPKYYSRSGPCMAKGDVNGDGVEDLFIGGAAGQPAALFLNSGDKLIRHKLQVFEADRNYEDVAALFFDADGDKDQDLYVGSGGYEFAANDTLLNDRLYVNDGKGNFARAAQALPGANFSTSCVRAADMDRDGDQDLFVGRKLVPGMFPVAPPSAILINDGKGHFSEGTASVCPSLQTGSLISDAVFTDLNQDQYPDLVTVGEWSPIKVYLNNKGVLEDATQSYLPFAANGWWNCVTSADLDGDGFEDLIAGNQGWNNQFRASEKEPMELFYKDFDGNGSVDPVLCYYLQGVSYPAFSRDDITEQLPVLKKKLLYYTDFANARLKDLFDSDQREDMQQLQTNNLATLILKNNGRQLTPQTLPIEAQYAPVYAITVLDANGDGKQDVLLSGNNTYTRIKFARFDASFGTLLLNNGKGEWQYAPQYLSGLKLKGDVRSTVQLGKHIIFGRNNETAVVYRINSSNK